MKRYIRMSDNLEKDIAMSNAKLVVNQLKRELEAQLRDYDVRVYVYKEGSTGFAVNVKFQNERVAIVARGHCFPYLCLKLRKQRGGDYLYNVYLASPYDMDEAFETLDEAEDFIMNNGAQFIIDEVEDAYGALKTVEQDKEKSYLMFGNM